MIFGGKMKNKKVSFFKYWWLKIEQDEAIFFKIQIFEILQICFLLHVNRFENTSYLQID